MKKVTATTTLFVLLLNLALIQHAQGKEKEKLLQNVTQKLQLNTRFRAAY